MKCPLCGDELKNGKCVFCGYEATEADMDARARYEAQKAAISSGPPVREKARAVRDMSRQAPREKARTAQAPAKAQRPTGPPARKAPAKAAPKQDAKAPSKQAAKAPPRQAGGAKKPAQEKDRPGFLKRWAFRLLVAAWIIAYILAIAGRASRGPSGPGTDPAGSGTYYGQQDMAPGEGGAQDA